MKETNVESVNKFTASSYGVSEGLFLNTDEFLFKEIIVINSGCVYTLPESCKHLFKDELEPIQVKELEQNKVTEDFTLKLVAMINNKEQFKDLK